MEPIDASDDEVVARIVAIQRATYRVEAELIGFDGTPSLHKTVDDVQRLHLQWRGRWDEGLLAGTVAWSETADRRDIDRLAVNPAHFRRGHGRALVSSLTEHPFVTVSTGSANAPALRLYESLGFVPVNRRSIAHGVSVTDLRRQVPLT